MSGRIGVDVGGTFTDVILHEADGRVRVHKLLSTPPSYDLRRGRGRLRARRHRGRLRCQRGRPRHDRRHERRPPAPRGRDRARHDPALPRRPRAAAAADPAHVRPLLGETAAARRAAPALRGRRADGCRRHRREGSWTTTRCGRSPPASGSSASTRSRSASSIPTSTPSMRSASARFWPTSSPRRRSRSPARSCASNASTSARRRRWSTPTCVR